MRSACMTLLVAMLWSLGCPLAPGSETESQPARTAWATDYLHAMDLANQQRKMLFIFFHDPQDPQSVKLQSETLVNAEVQQKLQEVVCLRLPLDATFAIDGKQVVLLKHPTLGEMLGRPGVAIADFAHADPKLHGC